MYTSNNTQGSEPLWNPPQSLSRTFVGAIRLAAFEELPTYRTTELCLQTGRKRCGLQQFLNSFFPHTSTPFKLPSSPRLKIFQNFWTISTTVLGEGRQDETTDNFSKHICANYHTCLQLLTPVAHSTS